MKKLISMALAAGMAVSLAACGGAASSSAPAADSAAASTTEAAADSDLAYIQGKGKMTIGYRDSSVRYEGYFPWSDK